MAKLADAPDLGLRNHRFQNIARHFKSKAFRERKTASFAMVSKFANVEWKHPRSSTNSSTQTRQTSLGWRSVLRIPSRVILLSIDFSIDSQQSPQTGATFSRPYRRTRAIQIKSIRPRGRGSRFEKIVGSTIGFCLIGQSSAAPIVCFHSKPI